MTTVYRTLTTTCLAALLAIGLAACGGGGGGTKSPPDLAPARTAAETAAAAAKKASDDAAAAVGAVAGIRSHDEASYARAQDAAADAMAASNAAAAASTAAGAAATLADAEAARDTALMKQKEAEDALAGAMMYAGMVTAAKDKADKDATDAAAEARALKDAKDAAGAAATAADEAATDAEKKAMAARTAANRVAELAPGTTTATNAAAAATAAEEAAVAARAAATAAATADTSAQASTTSADAKMHQATAEGARATAEAEQGKADAGYMTAAAARDQVEDTDTQTRIAGARSDAKKDMEDAQAAYTAARGKAEDARARAGAARAAANRAMRARTDYTEADKHADAAESAATRAEAAAATAMTASTAAADAYSDAMDATTVDAAETAAGTAKTQRMAAETASGTASDEYTAADTAATEATDAATTHVLALLRAANDVTQTDSEARAAAIRAVTMEIDDAAASTGNRNDGRSSGAANATVTWEANTEDDPDTRDRNEFVQRYVAVAVTGMSDDSITTDAQGTDLDKDGDFTDTGDTAPNAKKITGLPGFTHGYDATVGDQHVLVFTDKKQATPAVPAKTIKLGNHPVTSASRIVTNEDGSLTGALDDLGRNAKFDHDGNPDTLAVAGSWTCAGGADTCSVQVTDDKAVKITGSLLFSTDADGETIVAAKEADPMNDYLVFGVWLDEDADDNTLTANDPGFGAFANGGIDFSTPATLVGKATYIGAATGVYYTRVNARAASVDYFQGNATLTADFGAVDTDDERTNNNQDATPGTVTGTIDNIVAGGVSMSDVITLYDGAVQAGGGIDGGKTRMGAYKVNNDTVTYTYNGTWSGAFHGPAAAGDATGVELLPPAVAGTFGVTGTDDMGTATSTNDDVTRTYVGAFGASR